MIKSIFVFFLICLLCSCTKNYVHVYNNIYISNNEELYDFPVAVIKLHNNDNIIILPYNIKKFEICNNKIIFECTNEKNDIFYYYISKDYDEFDFEKKIFGAFKSKIYCNPIDK